MNQKKFNIIIDERLCKGCALCVNFCPTGALKVEYLKAKVADADKCIGCRTCEQRCPDFAIDVKEREE